MSVTLRILVEISAPATVRFAARFPHRNSAQPQRLARRLTGPHYVAGTVPARATDWMLALGKKRNGRRTPKMGSPSVRIHRVDQIRPSRSGYSPVGGGGFLDRCALETTNSTVGGAGLLLAGLLFGLLVEYGVAIVAALVQGAEGLVGRSLIGGANRLVESGRCITHLNA